MTTEEAKEYSKSLTTEEIAILFREHDELKQALCAQTLGIPTGCSDWIDRSIKRAYQLREMEIQFRKVVGGVTSLLEEASWRTHVRECTNCMGKKTVGAAKESCSMCGGTGLRKV